MKTVFTFLCIILLISCSKHTSVSTPNYQVEFAGTIQKQGMTTYQYGDYVISDDKTTYALRSKTVNLEQYVNKKVTIFGNKITGYPIEGGPDFIDVKMVKE